MSFLARSTGTSRPGGIGHNVGTFEHPQTTIRPAEAFTFTLGAQLAYGPAGGEYTLTLPTLSAREAALLRASSPQGAVMADAAGARLTPTASFFLWGRYAY